MDTQTAHLHSKQLISSTLHDSISLSLSLPHSVVAGDLNSRARRTAHSHAESDVLHAQTYRLRIELPITNSPFDVWSQAASKFVRLRFHTTLQFVKKGAAQHSASASSASAEFKSPWGGRGYGDG